MGCNANLGKTAAVAARRIAEAAGVAGDLKSWTPLQICQWIDGRIRHGAKIKDTDKRFRRVIPVGARYGDKAGLADGTPNLGLSRHQVPSGASFHSIAKELLERQGRKPTAQEIRLYAKQIQDHKRVQKPQGFEI